MLQRVKIIIKKLKNIVEFYLEIGNMSYNKINAKFKNVLYILEMTKETNWR